MELFTKLERDLVLAAQKKDQTALDALIAPEFSERTATHPEHPVARAEWMEKTLPAYRLDPVGHAHGNTGSRRAQPIAFEATAFLLGR